MDDSAKQILEQIKSCLERTMHDFDVDEDGDLYVRSGLDINTWVSVPSPNFVKLHTFYRFKDGAETDEAKANALVNRINYKFFPNSVSHGEGLLLSTYYIPILDGLSERNFIHMLRRCAQSLRHAVMEEDKEALIS